MEDLTPFSIWERNCWQKTVPTTQPLEMWRVAKYPQHALLSVHTAASQPVIQSILFLKSPNAGFAVTYRNSMCLSFRYFVRCWTMYSPVVTTCTAQWSLYVPPSGHYMYRTVVTICTAQWSLYVPHSDHYMYSPVVTICTTSLTFNNSTFSLHSCIYVFCVDLRTNSHYFPIQH